MSEFRVTRDYPYPAQRVWRALTDPGLVPLWTSTGQGGRPEGFSPTVGNRFRFVAKPTMGWRGIVDCEVVEVRAPHLLRYTWVGDEGDKPSVVAYRLAPQAGGTRFTWEHTGFTGVGGFAMSRLLKSVREKMLTDALPAVLRDIDDNGVLSRTSTLRAEG
ncbi:SRPBCC family protein [Actinoplanes rectilineatus]|uniref:SRPBCC family protein n=1 Tax=Actinoplanes rectilineatus TaxID=113571 RepID=UPI0005F2EBD3|nr:SRPBCC domain-containing protein [Actinoplanes rectilineatus]